MPVFVARRGDKVVLEVEEEGSKAVHELTYQQAAYLAQRLAELLGFRLQVRNPVVLFKLEPNGVVSALLVEGPHEIRYDVPVEVIDAYIDAIRNLSVARVSKRDLAAAALGRLASKGKFSDLQKFLSGSKFDWEKLFGDRTAYYVYFRVPVMILERLGVLRLSHGYAEVVEAPDRVKIRVSLERGNTL